MTKEDDFELKEEKQQATRKSNSKEDAISNDDKNKHDDTNKRILDLLKDDRENYFANKSSWYRNIAPQFQQSASN